MGAAKAAGYSRTHVYRVAAGDEEVRLALEAVKAGGGRGRRRELAPAGAARPDDPLGLALSQGAGEAVTFLRGFLQQTPDGEVILGGDQVRAAKLLLEWSRAPAKAHVVTARTLGPGGASEIAATTTMTDKERAALASKMFGP